MHLQEHRAVKSRWIANGMQPLTPMSPVDQQLLAPGQQILMQAQPMLAAPAPGSMAVQPQFSADFGGASGGGMLPTSTVAAPPASAPLATFGQDLSAALVSARLSEYEAALREFGCANVEDLADLEERDLLEIGMKKIEVKRLQKIAQ